MVKARGFTLIELIVVMAIVATLLTIAAPRYFDSLERSREAALKQTLAVTRDAIDKYHGDTGRYPQSVDELVTRRYLRDAPYDPIAQSERSWIVIPPARDAGAEGALFDVRSGAQGASLDGTPYEQW